MATAACSRSTCCGRWSRCVWTAPARRWCITTAWRTSRRCPGAVPPRASSRPMCSSPGPKKRKWRKKPTTSGPCRPSLPRRLPENGRRRLPPPPGARAAAPAAVPTAAANAAAAGRRKTPPPRRKRRAAKRAPPPRKGAARRRAAVPGAAAEKRKTPPGRARPPRRPAGRSPTAPAAPAPTAPARATTAARRETSSTGKGRIKRYPAKRTDTVFTWAALRQAQ